MARPGRPRKTSTATTSVAGTPFENPASRKANTRGTTSAPVTAAATPSATSNRKRPLVGLKKISSLDHENMAPNGGSKLARVQKEQQQRQQNDDRVRFDNDNDDDDSISDNGNTPFNAPLVGELDDIDTQVTNYLRNVLGTYKDKEWESKVIKDRRLLPANLTLDQANENAEAAMENLSASKYWSDPWQYADVTPAGIITRIRITQIFHSLQNDDLNQLFDSFASGNGSSVRKNILRSATLNLDVAIEEFERFGMDPIIVEKMPIAEMAAVLRLMGAIAANLNGMKFADCLARYFPTTSDKSQPYLHTTRLRFRKSIEPTKSFADAFKRHAWNDFVHDLKNFVTAVFRKSVEMYPPENLMNRSWKPTAAAEPEDRERGGRKASPARKNRPSVAREETEDDDEEESDESRDENRRSRANRRGNTHNDDEDEEEDDDDDGGVSADEEEYDELEDDDDDEDGSGQDHDEALRNLLHGNVAGTASAMANLEAAIGISARDLEDDEDETPRRKSKKQQKQQQQQRNSNRGGARESSLAASDLTVDELPPRSNSRNGRRNNNYEEDDRAPPAADDWDEEYQGHDGAESMQLDEQDQRQTATATTAPAAAAASNDKFVNELAQQIALQLAQRLRQNGANPAAAGGIDIANALQSVLPTIRAAPAPATAPSVRPFPPPPPPAASRALIPTAHVYPLEKLGRGRPRKIFNERDATATRVGWDDNVNGQSGASKRRSKTTTPASSRRHSRAVSTQPSENESEPASRASSRLQRRPRSQQVQQQDEASSPDATEGRRRRRRDETEDDDEEDDYRHESEVSEEEEDDDENDDDFGTRSSSTSGRRRSNKRARRSVTPGQPKRRNTRNPSAQPENNVPALPRVRAPPASAQRPTPTEPALPRIQQRRPSQAPAPAPAQVPPPPPPQAAAHQPVAPPAQPLAVTDPGYLQQLQEESRAMVEAQRQRELRNPAPPRVTAPPAPPKPPGIKFAAAGQRRRWTDDQLVLLERGMLQFGSRWREILAHYPQLQCWDPVNLKDKARNERKRRLKFGLELGPFSLATHYSSRPYEDQAPAQQAQGQGQGQQAPAQQVQVQRAPAQQAPAQRAPSAPASPLRPPVVTAPAFSPAPVLPHQPVAMQQAIIPPPPVAAMQWQEQMQMQLGQHQNLNQHQDNPFAEFLQNPDEAIAIAPAVVAAPSEAGAENVNPRQDTDSDEEDY